MITKLRTHIIALLIVNVFLSCRPGTSRGPTRSTDEEDSTNEAGDDTETDVPGAASTNPPATGDTGSGSETPPPEDPPGTKPPPIDPATAVPYVSGPVHSPISTTSAERLRAIAARGKGLHADVFMKVGDSISDSDTWFMGCFRPGWSYRMLELDTHTDLRPTIDLFANGRIGETSPLDRQSLSTRVSMGASWAVTPDDSGVSPLDQEYAAAMPQYATLMYGTNDLMYGGDPAALRGRMWRSYAQHMFTIVDSLIDRGVVPIMYTIPYEVDRAPYVPVLNALVRGIAQARGVPLVDYYQAMWPLPAHGIGHDGTHPTVYTGDDGVPRACWFTSDGLNSGYNLRNLLTMQALARVHEAVFGTAVFDAEPARPSGDGSDANPVRIDGVPFADMRSGRVVYRVTLAKPAGLHAIAVHPQGYDACQRDDYDCSHERDYSLALYGASLESPIASDNTVIARSLAAGTYHFVVANGVSTEPLLFVVNACEAGDAACD